MRICLHLDPARVLRWHLWLAEALAARPGFEVGAVFGPERRPLPRAGLLLFALERLVYGVVGQSALDDAAAALRARLPVAEDAAGFDAVVDLAGNGLAVPRCPRVLFASFDGLAGEAALIGALADGRTPLLEVHDSNRPGPPWTARPGLADRDVLSRSADNALSCAARLIIKALQQPAAASAADLDAAPPATEPLPLPRRRSTGAAVAHAAGAFAGKMARLLDILARGGKSWAVGWRAGAAHSPLERREAIFALRPDDGRRYYADPFPFCREGRRFVFVEEFPYATRRGCIAVFEIDAAGNAGPPRPVLEAAHHLSYPFVFEHDGEIWMIPESGSARGVYLYRAAPFPFTWRLEACLLSDIEAYDATLLRAAGRLWLFVCERAWSSSGWDMLSLFHADSLTGEWRPHARNPVVLDARLARPAGAVLRRAGEIVRPVQDCTRLYGGALPLCRIDALAPDAFRQTVVGRIHAGELGCHTYNRHGGIEVVDLFGRVRGQANGRVFFAPETARASAPAALAAAVQTHCRWPQTAA